MKVLAFLALAARRGRRATRTSRATAISRSASTARRCAANGTSRLRDLEFAIGLDAQRQRRNHLGRTARAGTRISRLTRSRDSQLRADGRNCALAPSGHLVDEHSDGTYAVLRFDADCGRRARAASIEVAYSLFFDLDPTHRGLLRFERGGASQTGVLSPERPRLAFRAGESSPLAQFLDYLREGVWHIWIGFDHILFLLSLLLPSVLIFRDKEWKAAERFRDTFWDVLKVVTVVHHRALDHPFARGAVGDFAAVAPGRIDDRALGGAGRAQQPETGGGGTALGGRVRLRPDPRLRLRQRAGRPRPAAGRAAAGAGRLQSRS